jgi:hypothetical protein
MIFCLSWNLTVHRKFQIWRSSAPTKKIPVSREPIKAMTRRPPQQLLIPAQVCRQCLSTRLQAIHPSIRRQSSSSTPPPISPSPSNNRTSLSQKTAEYIDTLQLRALAASQRLNDITGYSSIESLKAQIQTQGSPTYWQAFINRSESTRSKGSCS